MFALIAIAQSQVFAVNTDNTNLQVKITLQKSYH
jgi:hypothetical protein